MKPLAERLRPEKLSDVAGQQHLVGPGKPIESLMRKGRLMNMIFYGPPGTGKTTVANLLAKSTERRFYRINATNAGVGDLKEVIGDLDTLLTPKGAILYVDEIQHFNRKQQQVLLEHTENGKIVLIASTTENPFQYVYKALLSRSMLFEFKPVSVEEMMAGVRTSLTRIEEETGRPIELEEKALRQLAVFSDGDYRKLLTLIEVGTLLEEGETVRFNQSMLERILQKKVMVYDRTGDEYYDVVSAFQKSIRGSDPDAAVHYLARLVEAGDLKPICRRLLVIAAEDVGLAYPNAVAIVKSCVDGALAVGLPEARILLSEAVLFLALLPKSNSAIKAIDKALEDLKSGVHGTVPQHLRDSHFTGAEKLGRGKGYRYPHAYEGHYVKQAYLPEQLSGRIYYEPTDMGQEKTLRTYHEKLRK